MMSWRREERREKRGGLSSLRESTKLPTACTYADGQRSVPSA
jgi:hypothetical protein